VRFLRSWTLPAAALLCCALTACGSAAGPASDRSAPGTVSAAGKAHFDGPGYKSVEELNAAADVVVHGTVKGIRASVVESQLQRGPTEASSLPVSLYEVTIGKALRGTVAPTVFVMRIDTSRLPTDEETPFEAGSDVVLFLKDTVYVWDGVDVYVTAGMDQGSFVVVDGRLRGMRHEGTSVAAGKTVDELARSLT
jgi:hypothetical protein